MAQTTVHVRIGSRRHLRGRLGRQALADDRPARAGGRLGLGFSGADLLLMAIGACYVNDLQQEAEKRGIQLLGAARRLRLRLGRRAGAGAEHPLSVRIEATPTKRRSSSWPKRSTSKAACTTRSGTASRSPPAECEVVSVEIEAEKP